MEEHPAAEADIAPTRAQSTGGPNIRFRRAKRFFVWALVFGVCALLVISILNVPWRDVSQTIRESDHQILLLAPIALLTIFPLWVWQWSILANALRPVHWWTMAIVVAASNSARVSTSGLGGVVAGVGALHYKAKLTPSEAGAMMFVDQILAGGTKVLLILVLLGFAALPSDITNALTVAVSVPILLLVGAAVVFLFRGRLLVILRRFPFMERFDQPGTVFRSDVSQLFPSSILGTTAALAIAKKALEVASLFAVQVALTGEVNPLPALLSVAAVSLVSLLPLVPAQLGPQSMAVSSCYLLLNVPTEKAIAIGLLHYTLTLLSTGLYLIVAVFGGGLQLKDAAMEGQ